MEKIALEGFWLLAALAVVFTLGVVFSQYVKDKVKGVPSTLRSTLKAAESQGLSQIKDAQQKVVAEIASVFAKHPAPVAPAAPAAPVVAAAPAVPAAPAAQTA